MHKEEIADYISTRLGIRKFPFSSGSTEPKELLIEIADSLGIEFSYSLTKPQLAKKIVESAGFKWAPTNESNGGTITKEGFISIKEAVEFFLDGKSLY